MKMNIAEQKQKIVSNQGIKCLDERIFWCGQAPRFYGCNV